MAQAALATAPHIAPARYDGFDRVLVNGTWRHGSEGHVMEDRDPYTNEILVRICSDEVWFPGKPPRQRVGHWRRSEGAGVRRQTPGQVSAGRVALQCRK